ncbi:amidase [Nocardiopsis trehalosi]|uniref:amidase n=1 Tax=Nocardiopsis trehalosi TaxID=109329 RepID=UPI000833075C|nr:amidase [Nocardiopsis trehalosi]
MTEIHDLTANALVSAVRRRELSPVEIADHALARIDGPAARLGAFVTVTAEMALEQARIAEKRVLADTPEDLPPLIGVPVPVKDLDPVAGVRHTAGSAAFADRVAGADSGVVALLRAAGALLPGTTTTSEFGSTCDTDNGVAPPARSPWDPSAAAGGSSGGAAAAVAAGLAPVAHGSDGGGSIRIPAAVCGVVGLKPARGRVSAGPHRPDHFGLASAGPIARTVADAALLLDAISGPRPGDRHAVPPPPGGRTFLDHARREPGRLRVARYAASPIPGADVHPDAMAAYTAASDLLAALGHDVEDVDPPVDAAFADHFALVWAAMAVAVPVPPRDEHRLLPINRWLRERARASSIADYLDATGRLQAAARVALTRLEPYDAVLTPALAGTPVPVGHFAGDPAAAFDRMNRFTPFTALANVTGQPSISLPLHWTDRGRPVGVMLTGRPAGEADLLSLSAQIEAARPWAHRRPPEVRGSAG